MKESNNFFGSINKEKSHLKCDEYLPQAENLYVVENKNFTQIAEIIGISVSTIARWEKAHDWKVKKRIANNLVLTFEEAARQNILEITKLLKELKTYDSKHSELLKLNMEYFKSLQVTKTLILKEQAKFDIIEEFVKYIKPNLTLELREKLTPLINNYLEKA